MPRLGISVSACLLGQAVRFDGGHKRHGFLTGPLTDCVDLVPVCPEVGSGMGTPRPPIRLVGDPARPRAVGAGNPRPDVTEPLLAFARRRVASLGGISGYVLKQRSPSCGKERVKVYGPGGKKGVERKGRGLFARVLMAERPLLPVVEEVELGDPARREDFLTRVLVYHRWQALTAVGITPDRLLRFHADHEYLVMTHSRAACRHMEHLITLLEGYRQGPSLGLATGERVSPVATPSLEAEDPDAISGRYAGELMDALEHRAAGHTEHTDETRRLTDDYEPEAGSTDQAEPVIRAIAAYRRGERPLAVPITRLRRYLWGHPGSRLRNPARL